jgi:hypothetical protein
MFNLFIKNLPAVLFCALLLQGCKKDNNDLPQDENPSLTEVPEDYFTTESDPNGIEGRISYSNDVIRWESTNPFIPGVAEDRTGESYSDLFWLHVGDIEPYDLFGSTLSATHIDFLDNKAYVSYHKRGDENAGAIEVINLSDPKKPISTFRGYTTSSDFNAVTVGKDANGSDVDVWLAMSDLKKGAALGEVRMASNGTYKGFSMVELSDFVESGISSSANSIAQSGDYLYVTSGKSHGGAYCLKSNGLSMIGNTEFTDGKYIDVNGKNGSATKVVSLQTGEQATLRVEDIGGFEFAKEYNIGTILHQNVDETARGKSVLHFVDNNPDEVYVTMGMKGVKRFNIHSGEETWTSPEDMIVKGNANGITSDDKFIYVANGADGLTIFTKPEIGEAPERVFHWDLNDGSNASANMVRTYGDWVFIAKGQGGVKILKRPQPGDYLPIDTYNDMGVPDHMAANQQVCNTLLPEVFSSMLPENVNTYNTHPEYFKNNVPTNILITQDASFSITFLHEGAGYTNVLGYYYYDAANPPSSVNDIQKLIAFPNASGVNSGGGLITGNTVTLVGNFKANTVLGFFLNSNGWINGTITEGLGGQYTDPKFNKKKKRQSILMYDAECNATVIGFEDINLENSDKDFNDAIFQIKSYPDNAYDVSKFIQF